MPDARHPSSDSPSQTPPVQVLLKQCNLNECEARCCYDGVYLQPGEEERIRAAVADEPELFAQLPENFIVDGSWEGRVSGRKTAIRPHHFKHPGFPPHFTRTRCVFCAPDHLCLLQAYSVMKGLHKWAFKPAACWLFPLQLKKGGQPAPPPGPGEPDPDCLGPDYPGYPTFVPCGQHRPDGQIWQEVLREEIAHYEAIGRDLTASPPGSSTIVSPCG